MPGNATHLKLFLTMPPRKAKKGPQATFPATPLRNRGASFRTNGDFCQVKLFRFNAALPPWGVPREGHIISKESRSNDRLIHGIEVVLSRSYIENLSKEVRKGMRQRAAEGIYPMRPPLGYQNNKAAYTIEINSDTAQVVQRIFELFAGGGISLAELRKRIKQETGWIKAISTNWTARSPRSFGSGRTPYGVSKSGRCKFAFARLSRSMNRRGCSPPRPL